jgi:hypothetical protein
MEVENFDKWNIEKKRIENNSAVKYPKHREVWYISM